MLINVGKPAPFFTDRMKNVDGGVLEAMDDDNGLWFSLLLNSPSFEEIKIVREKKIVTRLLIEDDYVLPMIRFGNTVLLYEMSFDPTLYEENRTQQITSTNNVMTIALIDSRTGIIRALRSANLPLKFIQHCSELWSKAFLIPDYSKNYKNWYSSLQQQSLERLWMKATNSGNLGDSYNLDEINYSPSSQFYKDN